MADYFNPAAMAPKGDPSMWTPGPGLSHDIFSSNRADYNQLMDIYKQSQGTQLSSDQAKLERLLQTNPSDILSTNATNNAVAANVGMLKQGEAQQAGVAGGLAMATMPGKVLSTNAASRNAVSQAANQDMITQVQGLSQLSEILGQATGGQGGLPEATAMQQILQQRPDLADNPLVQHMIKAGPAPGKTWSDTMKLLAQHARESSPEFFKTRDELAGRENVANIQAKASNYASDRQLKGVQYASDARVSIAAEKAVLEKSAKTAQEQANRAYDKHKQLVAKGDIPGAKVAYQEYLSFQNQATQDRQAVLRLQAGIGAAAMPEGSRLGAGMATAAQPTAPAPFAGGPIAPPPSQGQWGIVRRPGQK